MSRNYDVVRKVEKNDGLSTIRYDKESAQVPLEEHSSSLPHSGDTGPKSAMWLRISCCAPRPWNLDSEYMLFCNGHGLAKTGTEEFRTLRSRLYEIRRKLPLQTVLIAS